MRVRLALFISLILSQIALINAQDFQFSQILTNQLHINPAFTGNTETDRFSLVYRNQWPKIANGFLTYAAAYDHLFMGERNRTEFGTGMLFNYNKEGTGNLSNTFLRIQLSLSTYLSRNLKGSLGVYSSYTWRSTDFSRFVFGDQILNNTNSSIEDINERISYADFGIGGLIYHQSKFWFGSSLSNVTEPNFSLTDLEQKLRMKYSFHGGLNIWKYARQRKSGNGAPLLSLNFQYKIQGPSQQSDIGIYKEFKLLHLESSPFGIGLRYRGLISRASDELTFNDQDAAILVFSVLINRLRITSSADISMNYFEGRGGAGEITIIYEWERNRKKRYSFSCPIPFGWWRR